VLLGLNEISTEATLASTGPFLQGVRDGDTVDISGPEPVAPETGDVVSEEVREQTTRTLENIGAVLEATVFATDTDDYHAVNEMYGESMSNPYSARSAV